MTLGQFPFIQFRLDNYRNHTPDRPVRRGVDLSLRGRQAVAIFEALADCFALLVIRVSDYTRSQWQAPTCHCQDWNPAFRGKAIPKARLLRSARNDTSNPSVRRGVDLSLRGRRAVAISEALADCCPGFSTGSQRHSLAACNRRVHDLLTKRFSLVKKILLRIRDSTRRDDGRG